MKKIGIVNIHSMVVTKIYLLAKASSAPNSAANMAQNAPMGVDNPTTITPNIN